MGAILFPSDNPSFLQKKPYVLTRPDSGAASGDGITTEGADNLLAEDDDTFVTE